MLINELNSAQKEAVEALEGAVLILAGAGTGKTKTLTTRISILLQQKLAFPSQILALTFTNKAAQEMRARVQSLAGDLAEQMPWLGTFHSICAKILRMEAKHVGLNSDFTILNADDQKRVVKDILKYHNIDEKQTPASLILHFISRWKDDGLQPDKIKINNDGNGDKNIKIAAKTWVDYQARLKRSNSVDFGDLINLCLVIFSNHNDVLMRWQTKFKYILVDEYQDTNTAQHFLLKMLAGERQNICCVGDDDQSIYGWRGAKIENILQFEKTYQNVKTIRLEQNYRSTKYILAAADALIANNKSRLGKNLWTESGAGNKIAVWECYDGKNEARLVCKKIAENQKQGVVLESIAILVRAGFQIREFEEQCLAMSIPYRIIGGARFYERAEIRDVNAYLRLIAQPADDLAFSRIVNLPKRAIGTTTIQALHALAIKENINMSTAAQLDENKLAAAGIKSRASVALRKFILLIDQFRKNSETLMPSALAEKVINESGIMQMWEKQKQTANQEGGQARIDNLLELVRAIGEFKTLADYLEHVALVMEMEQNTNKQDRINIMTLHASKGLEFDNVFLPGWEEETFPNHRSLNEPEGIEEERRLAYVGLTRTRQQAVISYALSRLVFNEWRNGAPSRFIEEIGEENTSFSPCQQENIIKTRLAEEIVDDNCGTRVYHEHFGNGIITAAQGNNLTILFDEGSSKMIKADFVKII